jgi:hypothetical protein
MPSSLAVLDPVCAPVPPPASAELTTEALADERSQWIHEECFFDFCGYTHPGHFPVSFWADTYLRPDGSRIIVCGGDWARNDGTARILPYSDKVKATLEQGVLDQFATEQAQEALTDEAAALAA